MDKRNRPAKKRYRAAEKKNRITISLTLDKTVLEYITWNAGQTHENNLSAFIEDYCQKFDVSLMPKRREFKTFPIKKTFTFSKEFVKKIKKSKNMSLWIDSCFTVTIHNGRV